MKTENKGFNIYSNTTHRFGLQARLLILIGKPLKCSLTITVDKEVEIIKTESSGYIEDLFPKKSIGGMEMMPQSSFEKWAKADGWRKLDQSEDWSNGDIHKTENELKELYEQLTVSPNLSCFFHKP